MTKFYVSATDKFMSNWEMLDHTESKLVFECDSKVEVSNVIEALRNSEYITDIKEHINKPKFSEEYQVKELKAKNWNKF